MTAIEVGPDVEAEADSGSGMIGVRCLGTGPD
jgi:hypothetical protein